MKPNVSIIILNWNGWKDTIECLESVYQIDYPNYNVLVVDNASEDDSIEKIKEYCTGKIKIESDFFDYIIENKPIEYLVYDENELFIQIQKKFYHILNNQKLLIIKNNHNYGFAEGNNIGIRFVLRNLNSDYILLLNNDTIVDKLFLNYLIEISEKSHEIGVVGPKTYYYDYNGRKDVINFAGGKVNNYKGTCYHMGISEVDTGQHNHIKQVDYVEGSCILIKKEVLENIGLLDKRYFAYWEDVDICVRGFKKGFKSFYCHKSKIWHKVSSSSIGGTKTYLMTRNRFYFMKFNYGRFNNLIFLIYFFTMIWFNLVIYLKNGEVKSYLCGLKDGLYY